MLAAQLRGANKLVIVKVPKPSAEPGEIVVRVKAASICGTDLRIRSAGLAGVSEASPRILGHEFAGDVWEVGEGVEGFSVGDPVTVAPNIGCGSCDNCIDGRPHLCTNLRAIGVSLDGGFAEFVRIPREAVSGGNVMNMPQGMTYEHACLNEALACCYHGFEACQAKPGDAGLIIGAGPIGVSHMILLKEAGVSPVIVSDLAPDRLRVASEVGADIVINPNEEDLHEAVYRATGGKGADIIITACPSPDAQAESLSLARVGARINFFGGLPPTAGPVLLETNLIHYKELIITGTTRSGNDHFRKSLDLLARGGVPAERLVTGSFALSDIDAAFEAAASGRHMKVVVVPDGVQ